MYQQLAKNNLNIFPCDQYQGLSVTTKQGDLILEYLEQALQTIINGFKEHHNSCTVRVDLKIPHYYRCNDDNTINRFLCSLNEQIQDDLARRKKQHQPWAPCTLHYIIGRELTLYKQEQYHVLLMFNLDAYNCIGDWSKNIGGNMAQRIRLAWADALGDEEENIAKYQRVYFPERPVSHIRAVPTEPISYLPELRELFYRISFFTKLAGKNFSQHYRPFLSGKFD